jgi:hypothetical protein
MELLRFTLIPLDYAATLRTTCSITILHTSVHIETMKREYLSACSAFLEARRWTGVL